MHPHTQTRPIWRPSGDFGPEADTRPVATRMAEAMRDQNAEGGCTSQSLLQAGFSLDEITQHQDDARRRAEALFMGEPLPFTDNAAATVAAKMRVAIGELFPSRRFIVTDLMAQGFSKAQIDTHLTSAYRHALKDAQSTLPSHSDQVQ